MLRFRQAMWRRIVLPCSQWPARSVPLRANEGELAQRGEPGFDPIHSAIDVNTAGSRLKEEAAGVPIRKGLSVHDGR